jgi:hypothetical protein
MKEHFVNYNQALALKELGFDEPCFGAYRSHSHFIGHLDIQYCTTNNLKQYEWLLHTLAPLKSQVFKWFRDEHNLYAEINLDSYKEPYSLKVTIKKMDATNTYVEKEFYPYDNGIGAIDNDKYEEAESACIDKLIEIIKNK